MHRSALLVCCGSATLTAIASGQLIVQEQFLTGADPLAGEYTPGAFLNEQGPTGGTILGYLDVWEAPESVEDDDYRGTAYSDPNPLTYQVGPESLATDGGCFRWRRTHLSGGDKWSWRETTSNPARNEFWASILIKTTEQSHYGALHLEFVNGSELGFGFATHGFPYIAELHGMTGQALTGQTHLLVARVIDDPDDGEWVQMWVDPVQLRASLNGDPPMAPDVEGLPGHDVIVGGSGELLYVTLRTHAFAGHEMFFDEIRVGGSWGDVVPVIVEPGCNGADVAEPLGLLDLADVNAFVSAFLGLHPVADLAEPVGLLDLADINAFVVAFLAGCP